VGALAQVALYTAPAAADARAEARAHFKVGMAAIAEKRFEQGIAELEEAYRLLPHPNVLFNIARAHAEAGHVDEALAAYKRYLEGDPPDRDEVGKIVAALEVKSAQAKASSGCRARSSMPAPGRSWFRTGL